MSATSTSTPRFASTRSNLLYPITMAVAISAFALNVHARNPESENTMNRSAQPTADTTDARPYLGMWVTKDGHIRHELLPGGRYDEQRGTRKRAYRGRYWIKGNRIEYRDDTGFSADGEFRDGVFHHGGYVFHREEKK